MNVFGPFVKRFALCYQTVVCPVCDVGVLWDLWPNGWMDQGETWHAGRPRLGPGHIVLDGHSAPLPQRGKASQFSADVRCGQTAEWIKMPLDTEVGLGPGDFVLDGDPDPHPRKGAETPPQFSAHSHCGQTAGWIKMPLGIEVGLGPGHIVLDGDPAPLPQKGGVAIFGPFLLWPNG